MDLTEYWIAGHFGRRARIRCVHIAHKLLYFGNFRTACYIPEETYEFYGSDTHKDFQKMVIGFVAS